MCLDTMENIYYSWFEHIAVALPFCSSRYATLSSKKKRGGYLALEVNKKVIVNIVVIQTFALQLALVLVHLSILLLPPQPRYDSAIVLSLGFQARDPRFQFHDLGFFGFQCQSRDVPALDDALCAEIVFG